MSEDTKNNQQQGAGANNGSSDQDNKGAGAAGGDQKPQTVPLADFLEQKRLAKELKEKVSGFEDRDKKAADAKLLEEKKYQDLIQNKDKELGETKELMNQKIKEHKKERLQDKFSRVLEKNNAISAEDALKFINVDELLDSDAPDAEIAKKVAELVKNKSYLFGKQGAARSTTENGQPSGNSGQGGDAAGAKNNKMDPIVMSLANKLKQS